MYIVFWCSHDIFYQPCAFSNVQTFLNNFKGKHTLIYTFTGPWNSWWLRQGDRSHIQRDVPGQKHCELLLLLQQILSWFSAVSVITASVPYLHSIYLKFCASVSVFATSSNLHKWTILWGLPIPRAQKHIFMLFFFCVSFGITWQQIWHQLECILKKRSDEFVKYLGPFTCVRVSICSMGFLLLFVCIHGSAHGCSDLASCYNSSNANIVNIRMCFWICSRTTEWGFPFLNLLLALYYIHFSPSL